MMIMIHITTTTTTTIDTIVQVHLEIIDESIMSTTEWLKEIGVA